MLISFMSTKHEEAPLPLIFGLHHICAWFRLSLYHAVTIYDMKIRFYQDFVYFKKFYVALELLCSQQPDDIS